MLVNLDATDGEMVVGVLTERGRPVKGYERSQPIRGDHIEATVSFSKPLADLVGQRGKTPFHTAKCETVQLFVAGLRLTSYWMYSSIIFPFGALAISLDFNL